MDDVGLIGEIGKALADVCAVKLAPHRVRDIVKRFRHEDALASFERRRFGEASVLARVLNTIFGSPRKIHPMSSCFQDVMLKVHLIDQDQSFRTTDPRKVLEPPEIPWIETREIIPAQAVPRYALTTPCPRLLKKWRPY